MTEGRPPISVDLDGNTARRLAQDGVITIYPLGPDRFEVSDAGRVGVARCGDVTVWIHPKIPIARLLWLLGFAHRPGWKVTEPVGYDLDDELVPALAHAYATQVERAIQPGLLLGYQEVDETTSVLRGRLRTHDQLRERYGLAVPLLVRYDDHTIDIAENRIVRAGLEALLRLPGVDAATRARLRRLRHTLADVTEVPAGQALPAWQPSPLNARYHDALWLAQIICAGGAVSVAPGSTRVEGFLVAMDQVFEDFVITALTAALRAHGGTCRAQDRWHLDEEGDAGMRPDLVWYRLGKPAAVIDAKYKAEKPAGYPNADLYQLLAYATALGLSEGHLVYAHGNAMPRSWRIRNVGITITAHTLDLDCSSGVILDQIDRLAARLRPTGCHEGGLWGS